MKRPLGPSVGLWGLNTFPAGAKAEGAVGDSGYKTGCFLTFVCLGKMMHEAYTVGSPGAKSRGVLGGEMQGCKRCGGLFFIHSVHVQQGRMYFATGPNNCNCHHFK